MAAALLSALALAGGHAYHVTDLIPSRPGLEVFKPSATTSEPADWIGDARTGQILWQAPSCGCDNGRGRADAPRRHP